MPCSACGTSLFVGGYRDGDRTFCSPVCYGFSPKGTFCRECSAETTDEPAGKIGSSNYLIGTSLLGAKHRCPQCRSIVQRKWLHVLVPIPRQRYRVIYLSGDILSSQFISRRVSEPLAHIPRTRPVSPDVPVGSPRDHRPPLDPQKWWFFLLVGLGIIGWAVVEYVRLTDLEQHGGEWRDWFVLQFLYNVGGKWAVVAGLLAMAAFVIWTAIKLRRELSAAGTSSPDKAG